MILHIPHSSSNIPSALREQIILDDKSLNAELIRMTNKPLKCKPCEKDICRYAELEILKHGSGVEVVMPESLRKLIRAEAEKIVKIDELVKSRHTREGGYPESLQLFEKTGFPIKDFGPTVGALSE